MKLILNAQSNRESYEKLFSLSIGEVFGVEDFETVMSRIEEFCPDNLHFEVTPINPGTSLYTIYGCGHCVVTIKEII